jgi:hypothetical protein
MRAKEFLLLEKTLEPATFYKVANLQAFIKRLESTGKFIDDKTQKSVKVQASPEEIQQLKDVVANFPSSGTMRKSKMPSLIPQTVGGIPIKSLFRELEFGGRGGVKGDKESNVVDSSKVGNVGPAVEAWKAIGIFSRLIKRTEEPVSLDEMIALKDELASTMQLGTLAVTRKQLSVQDTNGKAADTISVKLNIPLGSFQRAMAANPQDKELWGRITGIHSFINNNRALQRYNKVFSTNGRIDPVKIEVVGGEGDKTDVKTSYLDPDQNYKDRKVITSLSFSLKASSPKVDQSSGTTVEGIKKMFSILGLDDTGAMDAIKSALYAGKPRGADETDQQIDARYKAIWEIFRKAGEQLENKLARANDQGEANFFKHFFSTLTTAMTRGENMTFADFNVNGTYKQLNPKTIKNLAELVDLEAKVTTGSGTKGHPYLFVYDKNSNRNIMHVRLEVQTGGRLTLHYELDDLIDMAIEANNAARGDVVTPADNKVQAKPTPGGLGGVKKPVVPVKKSLGNPQGYPMGPEPVDDVRFSGE